MIGVFDSGIGGLTVLRALVARFPQHAFVYLGDHANMPYGNRPSPEIVDLTRAGVEELFGRGARVVLLGCNTATAVAARTLQRDWLPGSRWKGHNILGIVAPTVEAATQTPWAVTSPQYPQKYNTDIVAVFGTLRTITSGVYPEEIGKRCPETHGGGGLAHSALLVRDGDYARNTRLLGNLGLLLALRASCLGGRGRTTLRGGRRRAGTRDGAGAG